MLYMPTDGETGGLEGVDDLGNTGMAAETHEHEGLVRIERRLGKKEIVHVPRRGMDRPVHGLGAGEERNLIAVVQQRTGQGYALLQ